MQKRLLFTILIAIFLMACDANIEQVNDDVNEDITEETINDEDRSQPSSNGETENKNTDKADKQQKNEESDNETDDLSQLDVHYIDAGQADATLFQYADDDENYTILYDTGDWGKNDVINYLSEQDFSNIDLIIVSHPHADHIGQLADIVYTYDVSEVWMSENTSSSKTYQQAMEAIDESDTTYHEPQAGEVYDIGPMTIEIIHPNSLTGDLNEDSVAALFTYGEIGLLFTGDAYKDQELEMIERTDIEADILQLGHHGSDTSSDPKFIDAVQPDIAIYSAGKDNSYGHPHKEVVERIQNAGITLYGTDVHGTIVVTTNGDGYTVETKEDGTISPKDTQSVTRENDVTEETSSGDCIDINEASSDELQQIIHIGPARAEDILDMRPFQSIDDLTDIDGIGDARIDDIKSEDKACIGG